MNAPKSIDQLIDSSVYVQANWSNFFGKYGWSAARAAHYLAEKYSRSHLFTA